MNRPNILYLMTDQHLARALGCMGHDVVKTPNLDRLAARGTLFEQAYCPSPVCGPSRAALFSGLYPSTNGRVGNYDNFGRHVTILPEALRGAGYHTAMAGKLHLAPIEADWGFDVKHLHDAGYDLYEPKEPAHSAYVAWLSERRGCNPDDLVRQFNDDENCLKEDPFRFIMGSNWRSTDEHDNTWVTDRSIECLREAPQDRPFFIFTSWFGPHQPMRPPKPWDRMYKPEDITLPPEYFLSTQDKPIAAAKVAGSNLPHTLSARQYRDILAAYYGHISMIDHEVGRLLDALETSGRDGNTIVVFTADHGDHAAQFGLFFKCSMYENAARIPLIIADPKGTPGQRCKQIVNNLDVYASLLHRAGVTPPADTQSRPLTGLLDNEADEAWHNQTMCELGNLRLVAKGNYKLIRHASAAGNALHELYDLTTTVPDNRNLFASPEHADIRGELLTLLDMYTHRCAQAATSHVRS